MTAIEDPPRGHERRQLRWLLPPRRNGNRRPRLAVQRDADERPVV